MNENLFHTIFHQTLGGSGRGFENKHNMSSNTYTEDKRNTAAVLMEIKHAGVARTSLLKQ